MEKQTQRDKPRTAVFIIFWGASKTQLAFSTNVPILHFTDDVKLLEWVAKS